MVTVNLHDKEDLYTQVKEFIKGHIRTGNLHANDRLPTIREFADMTKVSNLTVQRAVAALVDEGLLYSRRRLGTFVRDASASPLTREKTGLYACVVPTIQCNTVASTVYAVDKLLFAASGQHLLLCNSHCDFEHEVRLLDSLLDRKIDALIYQTFALLHNNPVFIRAIDARLQKFLASGVPVVMLDEFPRPGRYDTILPDEVLTCELALRHLLDLGHRRILFVGHGDWFKVRIEAFHRLTREAGLGSKEVRTVVTVGNDIDVATAKALETVLAEGWAFSGIIAATDAHALGCYRFLKSRNIHCPEHVSIVGADNLEFIQNLAIHLTTIWCEPFEVAQRVKQQLETHVNCGDLREAPSVVITIPPTLVIRQSTGKPSSVGGT